MNMVQSMSKVEQMARRGVDVTQIMRAGIKLPERTIAAIIAQTKVRLRDEAIEARRRATREMKARQEKARQAGQPSGALPETEDLSLDRLLYLCATRAGMTVDAFLKPSRNRIISQARQEAMYLALVMTKEPTRIIAEAFERDEKTIRHGGCTHAARVGLPEPRGLSAVPAPKGACPHFLSGCIPEGERP